MVRLSTLSHAIPPPHTPDRAGRGAGGTCLETRYASRAGLASAQAYAGRIRPNSGAVVGRLTAFDSRTRTAERTLASTRSPSLGFVDVPFHNPRAGAAVVGGGDGRDHCRSEDLLAPSLECPSDTPPHQHNLCRNYRDCVPRASHLSRGRAGYSGIRAR